MIVADHSQNAAQLGRAVEIAMLDGVAGAVEPGILRVPDAVHAIELRLAEDADLLRTPHRGRPQLLIQAGIEEDVIGLEQLLVLQQLRIVAGERGAAIA